MIKLVSKIAVLVTIFMLICINGSSQLLSKNELDTCKTYTNLQQALQNPLEVYILDLTKTKLTAFPIEILEMKNLHILKLGKNKLATLPDSIAKLKYLIELDVSKNMLQTFPQGITNLTYLQKLILNQNAISAIPFDIKNLKNLEYLDMWSNELSYFPESMKELTSLKILDLRVIQFSKAEQVYITSLMPHTKILMSVSCNCSP